MESNHQLSESLNESIRDRPKPSWTLYLWANCPPFTLLSDHYLIHKGACQLSIMEPSVINNSKLNLLSRIELFRFSYRFILLRRWAGMSGSTFTWAAYLCSRAEPQIVQSNSSTSSLPILDDAQWVCTVRECSAWNKDTYKCWACRRSKDTLVGSGLYAEPKLDEKKRWCFYYQSFLFCFLLLQFVTNNVQRNNLRRLKYSSPRACPIMVSNLILGLGWCVRPTSYV